MSCIDVPHAMKDIRYMFYPKRAFLWFSLLGKKMFLTHAETDMCDLCFSVVAPLFSVCPSDVVFCPKKWACQKIRRSQRIDPNHNVSQCMGKSWHLIMRCFTWGAKRYTLLIKTFHKVRMAHEYKHEDLRFLLNYQLVSVFDWVPYLWPRL